MGNIEEGCEVRGSGDPVTGGDQPPLDHSVLGVGKVGLYWRYLHQVALRLLINIGQSKLRHVIRVNLNIFLIIRRFVSESSSAYDKHTEI